MRAFLVVLVGALTLAVASPAGAANSGTWTDRFGDVGAYTPDVGTVVALWQDDGSVGFGVGLNQVGMYSGDRVFVYVDSDTDGVADYRLEYGCCSGAGTTFASLSRWWSGGWLIDVPQQTLVTGYGSRQAILGVHVSEIGFPANRLHFFVRTQNLSVPGVDAAPAEGQAYVLDRVPVVAPPPVPVPAPGSGAPSVPSPGAAAPKLDRKKARSAVRSLVRKRLGSKGRITRLTCTTKGAFRCTLHAKKGTRRWKGTARVKVLASGTHRASFSGTRTSTKCKSCRARVRW